MNDAIAARPDTRPRGIRNNNPGNIRLGQQRWLGQVAPEEQTDTEFAQFETPQSGIRAIARIFLNYQALHRLYTVQDMIGRWAPPDGGPTHVKDHNATGAYVQAVAAALQIAPTAQVRLATDRGALVALVMAVIRQECGQQPYDLSTITAGVRSASGQ